MKGAEVEVVGGQELVFRACAVQLAGVGCGGGAIPAGGRGERGGGGGHGFDVTVRMDVRGMR